MRITVHPVHDGEEEELKLAVSKERWDRLGFGIPDGDPPKRITFALLEVIMAQLGELRPKA